MIIYFTLSFSYVSFFVGCLMEHAYHMFMFAWRKANGVAESSPHQRVCRGDPPPWNTFGGPERKFHKKIKCLFFFKIRCYLSLGHVVFLHWVCYNVKILVREHSFIGKLEKLCSNG